MSEARDRDKANLILLIGDFMAARRESDAAAMRNTTDAIQSFSEKTAFPNLATKGSATIAAASLADMKEGLKQMADIAEQLSPLRQTFRAAAEMAGESQASLFFPRAASTLVQVEGLLNSVLDVAASFEKDIIAARDDFDLSRLRALIEKIAITGRALSKKLDDISP